MNVKTFVFRIKTKQLIGNGTETCLLFNTFEGLNFLNLINLRMHNLPNSHITLNFKLFLCLIGGKVNNFIFSSLTTAFVKTKEMNLVSLQRSRKNEDLESLIHHTSC